MNTIAFGQSKDSLIRMYNNETIYRFGNKYMKGTIRLNYHDLAMEFTTPREEDLYKKSKKLLSVSRIFNLASLGLIITSVFTKTNVRGSIEFAAGTGLLGLSGIYFQTNPPCIQTRLYGKEIVMFYQGLCHVTLCYPILFAGSFSTGFPFLMHIISPLKQNSKSIR